jgi:hypothetical protein
MRALEEESFMTLPTGPRQGLDEIVGAMGAGGMGEV